MNMYSSIKPAVSADPFDFDAALTPVEQRSVEQTCHSFGLYRRVMLALATKDRSELAEACTRLNQDNALDPLLDLVTDYRTHLEQMAKFASAIEARVIVACHDALGLSLDETCPK